MYVDDQLPSPGVDGGLESTVWAQAIANLGKLQELAQRDEHLGPHPVRLNRPARDVREAQLHEHELRLRVPRLGDARRLRDGW